MGWVIDIPPRGPSAAPARWPYRQHRTMDVVLRHEAMARRNAEEFARPEDLKIEERLHRTEMFRSNRAFVLALSEARSARP